MKNAFVVFAAIIALAGALPACVVAAPEEIQVYTDDINDPGEFGIELHVNYALDGYRTPDYPGQLASHHVLQVTPEFSYGISKNWEAGLYLLAARGPDGNLYGNGIKPRLKYLRQSDDGFFWGLNVEIGYTSIRVSENHYNLEMRPIIGWRSANWLIAVNPIIGAALSGNVSREPTFEPAFKISRSIGDGTHIGLEHYADIGAIHHSPALNQQNHLLVAAIDMQKGPLDLNFGVGRGVTGASEKWVVKLIVGIPLQ